jgi:hypothetical protein
VSFAAQVPVGPLAAEIYRQAIGSGFDRRGREFMEELAGVVSELVEHFDRLPEELSKDDKFLDAVARASVTAMRDHRPQKREMLRNALLNAAQPSSFDEDIQQILFRFIDELTLTHVEILKAIASPQEDPKVHSARIYYDLTLLDFLKKRLPKTAADEPDLRIFIDELEARGLLPPSRTNPTGASPLAAYAHLTPMCKRLLEFIVRPPDMKTAIPSGPPASV